MLLRENQMVKNLDGSQRPLGKTGGGDISQLTSRVSDLEDSVSGLSDDVDDIKDDVDDIEDDVSDIITNLNTPTYSEQVLCYADGAAQRTKVTDPGRIAYVYEIDKSLGKKVLSSNIFFVKGGYIGNNDISIQMSKGVVNASLYGNPDGKFVFQITTSTEPENTNIVYLCGTIAKI